MKAGKKQMVKLSHLIEDETIYPRNTIVSQNISRLVQKIQAGIELDPIVIEVGSNRIIDGFHRKRAYLREFGPDHKVLAVSFHYANDSEAILHAAQLQESGPMPLNNADRALVISKLKDGGVSPDDIISTLGISRERYERFENAWAWKNGTEAKRGSGSVKRGQKKKGVATGPRGEKHFLKGGQLFLSGSTLSKKQVVGLKKSLGHPQIFIVNQVINLFENDILDREDEALAQRLQVLHDVLSEHLSMV